MSRILKRPMFRKGGSPNKGIMTGLVDRKQYQEDGFVTTVGQKASKLTPELAAILEQYTPETRLPIGEFGLNLASGMTLTDALRDPYKRFTRADDAREAAIKGGAAKLAIGQALKVPKDTRPNAVKLAEARGLVPGTKEFNDFIDKVSFKTEAAASGLQKQGVVTGGSSRDEIVQNTSFVKEVYKNLDIVDNLLKEDPTLAGASGSLRRFGNKVLTAGKDFNVDLTGPVKKFGKEELLLDSNIAKLNALEDAIAPAYARVLFPNQRITNYLIQETKNAIGLTGFTGSDEVKDRLKEIRRQFDRYIGNQEKLLGDPDIGKVKKYKIIDGKLVEQ